MLKEQLQQHSTTMLEVLSPNRTDYTLSLWDKGRARELGIVRLVPIPVYHAQGSGQSVQGN